MKRKAKTKGNLKGKINSQERDIEINGEDFVQITTSLPIRNHAHVLIIVRKEHGDGVKELLQDIWGTSEEKNAREYMDFVRKMLYPKPPRR